MGGVTVGVAVDVGVGLFVGVLVEVLVAVLVGVLVGVTLPQLNGTLASIVLPKRVPLKLLISAHPQTVPLKPLGKTLTILSSGPPQLPGEIC